VASKDSAATSMMTMMALEDLETLGASAALEAVLKCSLSNPPLEGALDQHQPSSRHTFRMERK